MKNNHPPAANYGGFLLTNLGVIIMESMIMNLPLDNGKYVINYEDNKTTVTRHGEPWRDLTGDNLFYYLLMNTAEAECAIHDRNLEIKALKKELETLRRNICVYAREEINDCFDDYSDEPDQEVLDFMQDHYDRVEGIKG